MFTAIAIHIGVGLIHGNQPKACAELLDMSTTPHCCSPSKHGVYTRWPEYWFGDGVNNKCNFSQYIALPMPLQVELALTTQHLVASVNHETIYATLLPLFIDNHTTGSMF